jgi:maleate isomerase
MPSPSEGLKVVVVVPATNTTMAPELSAYWPGIAKLWRVGVPRAPGPFMPEELPEYRENTLRQVAPLSKERPDIVLYGCTTAGFLSGPAGDAEMAEALANAAGAPAVTTAAAMVEALRHDRVSSPAVVTPYPDASNEALKQFLRAAGIAVPVLDSFRLANIDDYDKVPLDELAARALAAGRRAEVDGVFLGCTQMRTLGALERIRSGLAKPARGAVEATAWSARRLLNLSG